MLEGMKIVRSEPRFQCGLFQVTEDEAVHKDGFRIIRNVVRHNGSAVMMAVDDRQRVLLVRQYRVPAKQYLWELPAGKVDAGETPLAAAKRELIEETGYRARQWKKLFTWYPSPGFLEEKMNLFLARELREGEAAPMDDERIERRWFSLKDLDAAIGAGKVTDGKTMLGVMFYKRYKP
jgi:ADP-ribose pyrophosphatase